MWNIVGLIVEMNPSAWLVISSTISSYVKHGTQRRQRRCTWDNREGPVLGSIIAIGVVLLHWRRGIVEDVISVAGHPQQVGFVRMRDPGVG